jgi:pimeloyl-ACP methyl ester carboxylesterase
MSVISSPTRRSLLAIGAAAGAYGVLPQFADAAVDNTAIRPFRVDVPEADLVELRRRVTATRWPDKETVTDPSQGVQLATIQKLARYWRTEHDWRKVQARLNALPQFMTKIDGLDIHFIHVRSKHENALPMIVTHGWPGSIIEQLKIIEPLTNPTAHGGSASDAFDLVIPSLPGYGFSGKPTAPGWTPVTIARAWATLMQRLGYTRYVAQGGDWGNAVSEVMALQQPPGLLGIHTNMAATVPADVSKALSAGGPPPTGLSAEEKHAWDQLDDFYRHGLAHARKCRTGRKRFTESRIRRWASPDGYWITTSAVTV